MADMASAGIRAGSKTPLFVWLAGMLGSRASGTVPEVISSPAWLWAALALDAGSKLPLSQNLRQADHAPPIDPR